MSLFPNRINKVIWKVQKRFIPRNLWINNKKPQKRLIRDLKLLFKTTKLTVLL